jgi:hypothetical protein
VVGAESKVAKYAGIEIELQQRMRIGINEKNHLPINSLYDRSKLGLSLVALVAGLGGALFGLAKSPEIRGKKPG